MTNEAPSNWKIHGILTTGNAYHLKREDFRNLLKVQSGEVDGIPKDSLCRLEKAKYICYFNDFPVVTGEGVVAINMRFN